MNNVKICILGTGAWGTALACCLANNNFNVCLWGINQQEVNDLNEGYNRAFFGDRPLFASVNATLDLKSALFNADFILIAIPSTFITSVIKQVIEFLEHKKKYIVINVAKGLDEESKNVWSYTIYRLLNKFNVDIVTLIGPSFAIDVFEKKPTIVNVVSRKVDSAKKVAKMFNSNFFKAIIIKDERGAQVLASLKNLLAIAMGIAAENHNSINTVSALLTQGINEMQTIAKHMGAKYDTILQFCGIGDIFLTCTSDKSRNFTFGKKIFNEGVENVVKNNNTTVEGYKVYPIIQKIILEKNIDVPIFKLIIQVLNQTIKPQNFVDLALEMILQTSINKLKQESEK